MKTFGRVLAVMGVGLAVVGGLGAFALLPEPVLQNAAVFVEEKRQTLRAHLPEVPGMTELLSGQSTGDCAEAAEEPAAGEWGADAGCASKEDDESARMLRRSSDAASRFRAPAVETR